MDLLKYRIKTLFRYQDLIRELVSRDLKLKYRRSFLGYVWMYLKPAYDHDRTGYRILQPAG